MKRFWDKVKIGDGCWEWQANYARSGLPYGTFWFGKMRYTHRMVWYLIHAVWPSLDVLHSCDNPKCVRPSHLFLGTHTENMHDMLRKDRHGMKLNVEQALTIRQRCQQGDAPKTIAKDFGIDRSMVSRIKTNSCWRKEILRALI